jgi:formamidopyrimidine-DNA glycosylase
MGPEPLTIRPAQLARRLSSSHRPIKNALLDQKMIAGLGNIYADEALFRAGIHPTRRASDLTIAEMRKLNRAIKSVLRQALRFKGSTLRDYVDAAGNKGGFQLRHRVYDRDGEPCRSCKMPIERMVLAGRSAHFCPRCQPRANAEVRTQNAE